MLNSTFAEDVSNLNSEKIHNIAIAVVFLVFMAVGLAFNVVTVITYRRTRCLRKPLNVMIVGIAISDIVMILLGYPFLIISIFSGQWIFGDILCGAYAFIMNTVGCTNICILVAVALDRYCIIMEKGMIHEVTNRTAWVANGCCLLTGSAWAIFPLVGWGDYVVERNQVSCGPDWGSKNHVTYNVAIMIGIFVVPIAIMTFCYINILIKVFRKRRTFTNNRGSQSRLRNSEVTLSIFLNICSFVVAWLPYTVLSLWSMVHDISQMSETIALAAPLMAKTSSVWNPMVYVLRNREFRTAMVDLLGKLVNSHGVRQAEVDRPIENKVTSGNYVNLIKFAQETDSTSL